jgi:hypothetical protein
MILESMPSGYDPVGAHRFSGKIMRKHINPTVDRANMIGADPGIGQPGGWVRFRACAILN